MVVRLREDRQGGRSRPGSMGKDTQACADFKEILKVIDEVRGTVLSKPAD